MASTKQQPTMADLLNEVAALHRKVDELMSANKAPTGSGASKARKPKDPDAPPKAPNAWIVFTGKVRATLKGAGKPAGKEAQQFASHLKASFPEAYEMEPEAILEAHEGWEAPPPKPKPEAPEEEAKPKPKRTLSEAQKAAMAEGRRKAAAARKAAEAAAKAAKDEGEDEDEAEAEEADAKPPTPKAAPPPPAPTLKAYPFKGKRYLLDEATRGMWHREADGSKGAWAGRLSEDKKSLDASAEE